MDNKKATGIALGRKEKKLIDDYADKFGLSRSSVVRMAINDFFLRGGATSGR